MLSPQIVIGSYAGTEPLPKLPSLSSDGTVATAFTPWKNIVVGFQPRFVLLLTDSGNWTGSAGFSGGGTATLGGLFSPGDPLEEITKTTSIIGAEITSTGFRVRNAVAGYRADNVTIGDRVSCDNNNRKWIAFK